LWSHHPHDKNKQWSYAWTVHPGVNFTNILRMPFSYESFTRSFFVLAVKVKLFICARILAQLRQKNVGEIDSRSRRWWTRKERRTHMSPTCENSGISSFLLYHCIVSFSCVGIQIKRLDATMFKKILSCNQPFLVWNFVKYVVFCYSFST
jgi:hypothetical protein